MCRALRYRTRSCVRTKTHAPVCIKSGPAEGRAPSRQSRVAVGVLGILIGVVGLLNVLAKRRAANERRRILNLLAEDFRRHDQERRWPVSDTAAPAPENAAIVWEGSTFRPGDPVRIAKWAGTFKPSDMGAAVEVQAGPGRVGTVVGGERRESTETLRFDPNEPLQVVRGRWRAQKWKSAGLKAGWSYRSSRRRSM